MSIPAAGDDGHGVFHRSRRLQAARSLDRAEMKKKKQKKGREEEWRAKESRREGTKEGTAGGSEGTRKAVSSF